MVPTLRAGDVVLLTKRKTCRADADTVDRPCIKIGDIIAFEHPVDGRLMIKRVVATGGDTVKVDGSSVYNNNNAVYQEISQSHPGSYIEMRFTFPSKGWTPSAYGPLRVPMVGDTLRVSESNWPQYRSILSREGHSEGAHIDDKGAFLVGEGHGLHIVENSYLFVVGDNLSTSVDSRYWGYLPVKNVLGTVYGPVLSWQPYPRLRTIHNNTSLTRSK